MLTNFQPVVSPSNLKMAIAALFCCLPLANSANAATATSTFTVQMTVLVAQHRST